MNSTLQLCPLTDFAILGISGPDTYKFLQGQVTCDVSQISTDSSRLGAHCNPKGRMISNFLACGLSGDHIGLRLHKDVLPALQQSLGKYIVFSKAKLADHSNDYHVVGILGENADNILTPYLGIALSATNQAITTTAGTFICLAPNRIECWLTADQLAALQQQLGEQLTPAQQNDWLMAAIRAGIGEVYPQTQGEWIPQMLNYQLAEVNGVSFSKGCYTGQEIVARMQYLGKLKRHMYRFQAPACPQPGAPLYSKDSNQSIGEIVMASQVGSDIECLASVTAAAVTANNIYLDEAHTQQLVNLPLPYALSAAINTST